jgi:hypothetical protein
MGESRLYIAGLSSLNDYDGGRARSWGQHPGPALVGQEGPAVVTPALISAYRTVKVSSSVPLRTSVVPFTVARTVKR